MEGSFFHLLSMIIKPKTSNYFSISVLQGSYFPGVSPGIGT